MDDWAYTFSPDYNSDKKSNPCCWRNEDLHSEEMSYFVDRESHERQRSEPEEDERDEVIDRSTHSDTCR